ncbi:hypothetical protein K440DRAFT_639603 [Wilcoxina mikolae CBS 423.85]|nr:hypothetical protein K440DRAFT_639603 [Wilcoxina mikolae CBS 423.85]
MSQDLEMGETAPLSSDDRGGRVVVADSNGNASTTRTETNTRPTDSEILAYPQVDTEPTGSNSRLPHRLNTDGPILPSRRIESTNDLINFLETTDLHSSEPTDPSSDISYVLLVEDLSSSMMKLLGGYLKIPPQIFIKHISGGEYIQIIV